MKKVAVILSGCGVYDGSEIHESCAALLALQRAGAEAVICAPAGTQMHVVDHNVGSPATGESRNILSEAARIARGEISPLTDIDANSIDAVLLPGGFGAAKNLSTFAVDGENCTVNSEVTNLLLATHKAGKPIGALCIAPVILAQIFGKDLSCDLTIGNDPATAKMIENMGARHVECTAINSIVDEKNRLVSSPAYMVATNIGEVFDGVADCIHNLLKLCD